VVARCRELLDAGAFDCLFLDAGGEPELTKSVVLNLNGLADWHPPACTPAELVNMHLSWTGGIAWDPAVNQWRGLKAAAVEFSLREGGGLVQTIGRTQDGRVYPLIKANRGETIQAFVNDLLTPTEGVLQQVAGVGLRRLPRQRLPENAIGPGVSAIMIATHLQNLRKVRPANGGAEDWADGVENHLGLAACYARLASVVATGGAGSASGVWKRDRVATPDAAAYDRRAGTVPLRGRTF
jgi:hypothetical protein